ncbi:Rab interacting lysosomal protein-like 2-like [Scleropages formosus]|uniref:RILP-like protein 2 n=1 Tax=Scleropages formosus TaxID=113540 RepID=A0A0N8JYM0_SCLFO|nr:Rab interacting lysosomal protein-like 2-like [Scleropages formosus]
MQEVSDCSPALAFEKDAFELTVEDVYDISYVIGRDLLKIGGPGDVLSGLQFKIVRVLEMFETLVNKYNLTMEELKMERDNLKGELERLLGDCAIEHGTVSEETTVDLLLPSAPLLLQLDTMTQMLGPDKLVVDLKDPNRPRFTMQELKEVLQERNQLKAQLLVAQEELQLYKSGVLPRAELPMSEVDLESSPPASHISENKEDGKEEKTTIRKL